MTFSNIHHTAQQLGTYRKAVLGVFAVHVFLQLCSRGCAHEGSPTYLTLHTPQILDSLMPYQIYASGLAKALDIPLRFELLHSASTDFLKFMSDSVRQSAQW